MSGSCAKYLGSSTTWGSSYQASPPHYTQSLNCSKRRVSGHGANAKNKHCKKPKICPHQHLTTMTPTAELLSVQMQAATAWEPDYCKNMDGELRPVAFCSHTLTETGNDTPRQRSAWQQCGLVDSLHAAYNGRTVSASKQNHKPLILLINVYNLDKVVMQCQRLLMLLMSGWLRVTVFVPLGVLYGNS